MYRIRAQIKLYDSVNLRPIGSGYRPHFKFIEEMFAGGIMEFPDREPLSQGDEADVEIILFDKRSVGGSVAIGTDFTIWNGECRGEGTVTEIIDWT